MPDKKPEKMSMSRRLFLGAVGSVPLLGGAYLLLTGKTKADGTVWQIDPAKCTQCGRCADYCVLTPSAVKCMHSYDICGYCELCSGYHKPGALELDTAAENQVCPTRAIKRTFVEEPFYQYDIDEQKCIGCGKCVAGCAAFGNGSLYLQINRKLCVDCNECSIANVCPGDAVSRIPAEQGYIMKQGTRTVKR